MHCAIDYKWPFEVVTCKTATHNLGPSLKVKRIDHISNIIILFLKANFSTLKVIL